jgi:hypothetical protein
MTTKPPDKPLRDPAAAFESPAAVVRAGHLSREQKIEILRRWEYDARELQVADDENMASEKLVGENAGDLLQEVRAALRELDADSEPGRPNPTKHGGGTHPGPR